MSHYAALDIDQHNNEASFELYATAYDRIHADPALAAAEDLLLHEWTDYADHLRWVVTASTNELTDWVWRMKRQAGRTA